jgi:hypothetical protein
MDLNVLETYSRQALLMGSWWSWVLGSISLATGMMDDQPCRWHIVRFQNSTTVVVSNSLVAPCTIVSYTTSVITPYLGVTFPLVDLHEMQSPASLGTVLVSVLANLELAASPSLCPSLELLSC